MRDFYNARDGDTHDEDGNDVVGNGGRKMETRCQLFFRLTRLVAPSRGRRAGMRKKTVGGSNDSHAAESLTAS